MINIKNKKVFKISMRKRLMLCEFPIEEIKKRLNNYEYHELFIENFFEKSFSIHNGIFNGEEESEYKGLRIRALLNNSLYTLSTNKKSKSELYNLLEHIKKFKGIKTYLSNENFSKYHYKVPEKISIDDIEPYQDIMDLYKNIVKANLEYLDIYLKLSRRKTLYTNSNGAEIEMDIPFIDIIVAIGVKNKNEIRESYMEFGIVGGYELIDLEAIKNDINERIRELNEVLEKGINLSHEEIRNIKNIVISPEITGIAVHESIGHPFEADRIFGREAAQAGTSYLNPDDFEVDVGSEHVNIIDDPTMPHASGFYLFDEEGVKARPKVLVEKGVEKELLLNREYAFKVGSNSNASARSDMYLHEPIIRMSNTFFKNGNEELSNLIKDAKNGIYVKNFSEWNIDDTRSFARYQGNIAYLIEKGSITKPVKNFIIETTTSKFWHAVAEVGNDFKLFTANCGKGEPLQGVPVTNGGPSLLLKFE